MEPTNKEIIYCQKVLHLLEDLQKVQQSIESFAEYSDKQKIHTHQTLSLILKLIIFLIILGVGILLKLSLVLLLVISVVYLFIFCLLFRYDSKKFKEKLALGGGTFLKMKSLNADLNKLKAEEIKIQTELNHFNRIPSQFKTIEVVSHMIRYMKRGEAQNIEEALYFWKMDETKHSAGK
ncbi:hypothetical protein EFM07_01980 [Lactococcus lactis]|nr:hypothetical protein [Lactococcus lactis]